jgi:quercetin dioxygenase-like cupin family protein
MNRIRLFTAIMLIAGIVFCVAVQAQETSHAVGRNLDEMKFVLMPGLPSCAQLSVQNGDPTAGPSIILIKTPAGCAFPWHWHTPNEHVMLVSGAALVETRDGKTFKLRQGGFTMLPSRHIHQFRAEQACVLYLYPDAKFDIHYVDEQGNEIPPQDALKKVGETTVTEMKPVETK